jgi:hypothetical protein
MPMRLAIRERGGWLVRVLAVDEARTWRVFAVAALLGCITCSYAFGVELILGRGPFWSLPDGDAMTNVVGYRYYLADDWHWPLLKTTLIGGPKGTNIVVLDSIPIVALLAKFFRPVLGSSLLPYGMWMLAVYVLQATFAVRLVRALGHRTWLASLAAAIAALTFHAFLARFYHLALNAHFVILWALCLYFELRIDDVPRKFGRAWIFMLVIALLVHPYLFAMCAAVYGAALVHGARLARKSLWVRAKLVALTIASLVLVGTATGHLARSMRKHAGECCFGQASTNLGSLVVPNPARSQIWSDTPAHLLEQTSQQWDGSMFLGFGTLLLLVVALAMAPRELGRAVRRHAALAAVLLAMLAFAASNRAYFLDHQIWRFDTPQPLEGIAATFRASGRFAWPFGLVVLVGSVAVVLRRIPLRISAPIVVLSTAVAIVDAFPTLSVIRANTSHGAPEAIPRDAYWRALAVHDRVEQYPSFQCLSTSTAIVDRQSRQLQLLAAELARPINGVRAARQTTSCRLEAEHWKAYEITSGVIRVYVRALMPIERPDDCRPVGVWVVCTDRWSHPQMGPLRLLADSEAPPRYQPGEAIDLGGEKRDARYLDGQWSLTPSGDSMAIGKSVARVRMAAQADSEYVLAVDFVGIREGGRVLVAVNGVAVGDVQIGYGQHHADFALPRFEAIREVSFRVVPVNERADIGVRSLALKVRE